MTEFDYCGIDISGGDVASQAHAWYDPHSPLPQRVPLERWDDDDCNIEVDVVAPQEARHDGVLIDAACIDGEWYAIVVAAAD